MSKIQSGQKFGGDIADILNAQFAAKTAKGMPLAGYQRSTWPSGVPFLKKNFEALVWFPTIADSATERVAGDWRNVVNEDRSVITTEYVGKRQLQDVIEDISSLIGKLHIVFAKKRTDSEREFYGIYTSEIKGDKLVYRRISDSIETLDWQR